MIAYIGLNLEKTEVRAIMDNKMPSAGDFYKHFKGKLYQVKMLAKDSETGVMQVVYQAMYPPFQYWVRPLDMFLEPVDHSKYPNVTQKNRFEKVDLEKLMKRNRSKANAGSVIRAEKKAKNEVNIGNEMDVAKKAEDKRNIENEVSTGTEINTKSDGVEDEEVDDEILFRALRSGQPERYLHDRITEQEIAERGYMKVLDAETYREKRQLMIGLKQYLDKRLLHNIAASMDIVLEEGDLDSQYDSLLHCLDTMEHFEGGRLR